MALTLITLAAPTGVTASAVAGGTIPDGTYYIIVVAYNYLQTRADNEDAITRVKSPISAEVTVVLTTGNNTINVSWNAVSGALSYKVYITTVASGIGRWSGTGVKNVNGTTSTVSPTTNVTSISLTDTTNMNKPGTDWICYPYDMPYGIDRTTGSCLLTISGSNGAITLATLVAALPVGQYYLDASQRLVLICNVVISASATGSINLSRINLICMHCIWQNDSGGAFTVTWNISTYNGVGNYGSMQLQAGDSISNSIFITSGTSNGFIIDNVNNQLVSFKRLRLGAYTDGGNNTFMGAETTFIIGDKNNVIFNTNLNLAQSSTTNYILSNCTFNYYVIYQGQVNSEYTLYRNCNFYLQTYHIYMYYSPSTHLKFYDYVFNGVSNNLPIIYFAYSVGSYNGTNTIIDIYNSCIVTIVDVNNSPIVGATCNLTNINNVKVSGVTDSSGICNFGDILTNSLTSSTPNVAGLTSTVTNLGPFTITISKLGYETYYSKFTLSSTTKQINIKLKQGTSGRDNM